MKIFISWSKHRSKAVASLFHELLKSLFVDTEIWISSKDLDAGTNWFGEIQEHLKGTNFGIVFVTKENKDNPWLLFEAGALAKDFELANLCTVLVDVESHDIEPPLSLFQATKLDLASVLHLVKTINKKVQPQMSEENLEILLEKKFPILIEKVAKIKEEPGSTEPMRSDRDLLIEILDHVRGLKSPDQQQKEVLENFYRTVLYRENPYRPHHRTTRPRFKFNAETGEMDYNETHDNSPGEESPSA